MEFTVEVEPAAFLLRLTMSGQMGQWATSHMRVRTFAATRQPRPTIGLAPRAWCGWPPQEEA